MQLEGDCDCSGSQLDAIGVCGGDCNADDNLNGVCDDSEIFGCTDVTACNYDETATLNDDSCTYPESGYNCDGILTDCEGCQPVFTTDISDYSVQCEEDLPGECDPTVEAINPCTGENVEVFCQYNQAIASTITNNVETAYGPGVDGAFRIYGLSSMYGVSASDYFVEVEPLVLVRYPATGTARLTGEIACMADADQTFAVDVFFENQQNAIPWLAESNYNTLLTAWNCTVDPAGITVYTLQNTISRLTGTGTLEGQIYLDHMPVSLSKRFQLGVGGNNHNCGYGLGGWFAWNGTVDGQTVSGLSGDIIVDLDEDVFLDVQCGGEFADIVYAAIDPICGNTTVVTQHVSRVDTEAPVFTNGPEDQIVECDMVPEAIDPSELTAIDNCIDLDAPVEILYDGELRIDGDCPESYELIRRWSATDCTGNAAIWEQSILVQDTTAPSIEPASANATVECDGAGNLDELQAWIASNGGASATDNCGDVTWNNDFNSLSDDCGVTGSATVTFSASDNCGNVSTTISTFTIEDTIAPEFGDELPQTSLSCDNQDVITVDATDGCGDVVITYFDVPVSGGCVTPIGTLLRTYTATDECENATSIEQIIVLLDEVAPVITSWPADYTAECSDEHPFDTDVMATDNCDSAPTFTISVDTISGDCIGNFTILRTFTATDHCDNTSSEVQTITIQDATAPEFTNIPEDYTAECSDAHPFDLASAEDNCGDVEIVYAADTLAGSCIGNYTITRTFTATDECGNSSASEQVITIVDTTGPEFTSIPADYTAECSDAHPFDSSSAVDNCGSVEITETTDTIAGGCTDNFTIVRVFTATDDCGNETSATQTISIVDTTAPVFEAYENFEIVACDFLTDPNDPTQLPLYAEDNCGEITYSVNSSLMSGGCLGVWMRIWTATDDCGNFSTAEQFVSLTDFVAPTLEIPADYTGTIDENCEADLDVSITGQATSYDNCGPLWDNLIEVTFEDELISFDCDADDNISEGSRTIHRTWTAMDACENATSLVQVITLLDEIAPTASIEDASVTCEEYASDVEFGSHTESDNCDTDVSFTWVNDSIVNVEGAGCYQALRTYTWIDDCGNTTAHQQTITVYDNVGPIMTGDIEITIECDNYPDLNTYVTGEDNCGGDVEITFTDQAVSGGCVHPVGMYMRTYIATDDCGNSSMFEQFLRLVDETAPEFTYVPADYTSECSDELILELAEASDNCATAEIVITEEVTPGSCEGEYTLVRTFTAEDDCDNFTVASQTILIVDTTGPSFDTVPSDYTIECNEELTLEMATASDLCSTAQVEVTFVEEAGECDNEYTLIRTFSATDECGNVSFVDQTISVVDTTAPEFTFLPADYTAECSDILASEEATAIDNCGSVEISVEESSTNDTDCPEAYVLTRVYTATDLCGNETSATQTITVVDTTAPDFGLEENQVTLPCDEYDVITVDATDNCGEVTITYEETQVSGGCVSPVGTLLRTYTATDDCGNSSSFEQIILLFDETAPEFTSVPADITVECSEEPLLEDAIATDNCSSPDISEEIEVLIGDCNGAYSWIRTFTATDNCGNATSAQQVITFIDTTAPAFTSVPEDYTTECSNELILDLATASDLCSETSVTIEEISTDGDCPNEYTLTRTFTATDECGNSSSATQLITIVDTTAPEFTFLPEDFTAECSDELALEDAAATDNCGTVEITVESSSENDAECPQAYVLTRVFTATDLCGNTTSATQTITVVDTTAPDFGLEDLEVSLPCDEYDVITVDATDNCGEVTITYEETPVSGGCVLPVGTFIRVYTATDDCGNSSTLQQIIVLFDETAPEFTSVPADFTIECSEELILEDATAIDNCSDPEVTVEVEVLLGDCNGAYSWIRTFKATDNCGNETSAQQVITFIDTTAPEFTSVPEDYTTECSNELVLDLATASDLCTETTVTIEEVTTEGDCSNEYTLTRTFTATDECGNENIATQVITIVDTTAPEFTFLPADFIAECSDELSLEDATATDNCGEVDITVESSSENDTDCPEAYVLTRVFTATDLCGNATSATQTITVVDTTAPVFTLFPEDSNTQCEEAPYSIEASDNCGSVSIEETRDTLDTDGCGNYTHLVSVTATDACGNVTSDSFTIIVQDTEAPQITDSNGLDNGDIIEVCWDDVWGNLTIPNAVEISYVDNCDIEVGLEFTEETNGEFAPSGDVTGYCTITTPQALEDGETCDNYDAHSIRMFNFPGDEFYTTLEGLVSTYSDGTRHIELTAVSSANPNAGWTVIADFSADMTWDEWSGQEGYHSFKSDCGLGDHTLWHYAILQNSSQLIGWGDYEGNLLSMSHQPSNEYFGFQLGEGANNKNSEFGFSGWFYYSGEFQGESIMGSGDLFGDLNCCLPYEITRDYTLTDCSGNSETFGYIVDISSEACINDEGGLQGESEESSSANTMAKDYITIDALSPNPTNSTTTLTFTIQEVASVKVEVMTMEGSLVLQPFEQVVIADWPQTVLIGTNSLEAGMYQVRVTSRGFITSKKLLVIQ